MEVAEDARLAAEFPEEAEAFKKLEETDVLIELDRCKKLNELAKRAYAEVAAVREEVIKKLQQGIQSRDLDVLHRVALEVLGMIR